MGLQVRLDRQLAVMVLLAPCCERRCEMAAALHSEHSRRGEGRLLRGTLPARNGGVRSMPRSVRSARLVAEVAEQVLLPRLARPRAGRRRRCA